jgi:predicted dehydrogenase
MRKVGMLGAGYITNFAHLPSYASLPDVDLVAICDRDKVKAVALGQRFGIRRTYVDLEEMLAQEELDLLDVCLPPHQHYDALVRALEADVACLVEKPLTVWTADADRIVSLTRTTGLPVFVIFNYSFVPAMIRARQIVAEGSIGEVSSVHVNHGVPWASRHVTPTHWCHKLPGGYLSEVGPHLAMLMLEFLGSADVVKAIAFKRSAIPFIEFDELRIIARSGDRAGSITCSLNCPSRILTIDILGTQGALHVDGNSQAVIRYGPVANSLDVWARGWFAATDILSRVKSLARTTVGVLIGEYTPETYGHRYLIRRAVRALNGTDNYPVDLTKARDAVHLLELAFAQIRQ